MADPPRVNLSLEDQFRFQALRAQVKQADNRDELRIVALQLIDLMEQQKRTVLGMLQAEFLGVPRASSGQQPQ